MNTPFYYVFKVKDLHSTRKFYIDILGCQERPNTDEHHIDLNFFGHQISAYVRPEFMSLDFSGMIENVRVPIPHFGCLLQKKEFDEVYQRLQEARVQFLLQPQTRFMDQEEEHRTMFVLDFSGNPLEFKNYKTLPSIFGG